MYLFSVFCFQVSIVKPFSEAPDDRRGLPLSLLGHSEADITGSWPLPISLHASLYSNTIPFLLGSSAGPDYTLFLSFMTDLISSLTVKKPGKEASNTHYPPAVYTASCPLQTWLAVWLGREQPRPVTSISLATPRTLEKASSWKWAYIPDQPHAAPAQLDWCADGGVSVNEGWSPWQLSWCPSVSPRGAWGHCL